MLVQDNKPMTAASRRAPRRFMDDQWPGNVRQLENLIKRMVVLGSEAPIPHRTAAALVTVPGSFASSPSAPARPAVPPSAPAHLAPPPAPPSAVEPVAGPLPTATAAGNVSLKDISRCAAREAERELILRMLTPHAVEPEGGGGNPRHQLQGAPLQDQGAASTRPRSGDHTVSDQFFEQGTRLLTPNAFESSSSTASWSRWSDPRISSRSSSSRRGASGTA